MKKVWILTVLFAFAGCQPDAQQSPVAPPVAIEMAGAQEKAAPAPVVPASQQETAKEAAAQNLLPAQPKPDVTSPPQVVPVHIGEPVKTETAVVTERAPVTAPTQQGGLSEADAIALAKKKNCFACHALDKKTVGPAWRAVAQKYRGQAGAQTILESKVRKGGKGDWGSIAMPPQPALSGEELTGLVQFVLQLQ